MPSTPAIALSGLTAATTRLGAAAHNVANAQTAGFHRQVATARTVDGGGVRTDLARAATPGNRLEADLVDQLAARHGFMASLAVFRTHDRMMGSALDLFA